MDFQTIRYIFGTEVVTHAAGHNSYDHHSRAFWTNVVNPCQLQKVVELTYRTTTRDWRDCLEPRHRPNVALRHETKPFYRCNITRAPVRVARTFVSYRESHTFRNRGLAWSSTLK